MEFKVENGDGIDSWKEVTLVYSAALRQMETKMQILNDEFQHVHQYNPIEHIKARIKTPESIVKKLKRYGYDSSIDNMVNYINDIAGIRIVCSFTSDIYRLAEMIGKQTINQKTFGETRGQSGSSSKNIQIQGRDLIDAAEIGKMNRREAILLIAGTNPLKDLKYPVEQHPNYIYLDPGRNKPGQVKNRCLYDEPFNILEYMDEIRTKDDTYAS